MSILRLILGVLFPEDVIVKEGYSLGHGHGVPRFHGEDLWHCGLEQRREIEPQLVLASFLLSQALSMAEGIIPT